MLLAILKSKLSIFSLIVALTSFLLRLLRSLLPETSPASESQPRDLDKSSVTCEMDSSKSPRQRNKANPSAVYCVSPFDKPPSPTDRSKSPPVPGAIGNAVSQSVASGQLRFTPTESRLLCRDRISPPGSKSRHLAPVTDSSRSTNATRLREDYTRLKIIQHEAKARAMKEESESSRLAPRTRVSKFTPTTGLTTRHCDSARAAPSRVGTTPVTPPLLRAALTVPKSLHGSAPAKENVHRSGEISKAKNGLTVSKGKVNSQVTTPKDSNVNLRLNFTVACQGTAVQSDSTPLSRRDQVYCDTDDTYKRYKIPDPTLSLEERARAFSESSPKSPIKSGLVAPLEEKLSVMVAVRLRPFSPIERSSTECRQVVFLDKASNSVRIHGSNTCYKFNAVLDSFDPNEPVDGQGSVYETVGLPVVRHALDGYNACLFAYGQTGSGKTYSIAGDQTNPGVIPRLVDDLFRTMPEDTRVAMTYIEIYNDAIANLLEDSTSQMQKITYKIREHSLDGPYIPNLIPVVVEHPHDLLSRWTIGSIRRSAASTMNNYYSSRSHAILQIIVQQKYDDANDSASDTASLLSCGERLVSKINIVDLAGSERSSAHTDNTRFKEGSHINKSLLTLGKVINELSLNDSTETKRHIPYRESPLTFLLKESLGGNSRTCMLATISPASSNLEETQSTLRYASKAQLIVNRVRVNEDPKIVRIRLLQKEIECLLTVLAENEIDPRPRLVAMRKGLKVAEKDSRKPTKSKKDGTKIKSDSETCSWSSDSKEYLEPTRSKEMTQSKSNVASSKTKGKPGEPPKNAEKSKMSPSKSDKKRDASCNRETAGDTKARADSTWTTGQTLNTSPKAQGTPKKNPQKESDGWGSSPDAKTLRSPTKSQKDGTKPKSDAEDCGWGSDSTENLQTTRSKEMNQSKSNVASSKTKGKSEESPNNAGKSKVTPSKSDKKRDASCNRETAGDTKARTDSKAEQMARTTRQILNTPPKAQVTPKKESDGWGSSPDAKTIQSPTKSKKDGTKPKSDDEDCGWGSDPKENLQTTRSKETTQPKNEVASSKTKGKPGEPPKNAEKSKMSPSKSDKKRDASCNRETAGDTKARADSTWTTGQTLNTSPKAQVTPKKNPQKESDGWGSSPDAKVLQSPKNSKKGGTKEKIEEEPSASEASEDDSLKRFKSTLLQDILEIFNSRETGVNTSRK